MMNVNNNKHSKQQQSYALCHKSTSDILFVDILDSQSVRQLITADTYNSANSPKVG